MRYYIIAGEASGDLHASNLMREISARDPQAEFRCWGGDLMEQAGGVLVKHYKDLAFMGFVEVLMNIRTVLGNLKFCKKDISGYRPDVVILVDYPGFNLRMAAYAHKAGFPVYYYISPQAWAWKKSRVKKIRRYVDHMFVILPFEKAFYARYDHDVDFVGHPLLDVLPEIAENTDRDAFLRKNGLPAKPVIALLPGSRKQEISIMLRIMLQVIKSFQDHQFVIAGAPSVPEEFYQKITKGYPVKLIYGQMHGLLACSRAALVTSGTATLETALMEVPEVVCYKSSFLSYYIARNVVDIAYISLVNLIMDKPVVRELIQQELTAENLKEALMSLLYDANYRSRMIADFRELKMKLGGKGASRVAAEKMLTYLKKKKSRE